MREGRRCDSKRLKENRRIDLRMIREIYNEVTKWLKRNTVIVGTLEADLNSEVLSIGLKKHWENKAVRSPACHATYEQVLLQDIMSGAGRAVEEQRGEETSSAA